MNNKTKILIIAKDQFGYLTDYYYWSKFLQPEFDVYFLHYFENKKIVSLEGVKLFQLHRSGNKIQDIARLLIRFLQISYRYKIDLTFVEYFKYCSVLRLLFRKKIIVDIRSGYIGQDEKKRIRNNKIISFLRLLYSPAVLLLANH